MKSIGKGVREIRFKVNNQYRIVYLASLNNTIYVLHAFVKKTQKTSNKDLKIAEERYKQINKGNVK